jgi:hypothetical protein
MTATITWSIDTCEHEVSTGGITVAHWRANAVDGDYSAGAYGSAGFTPDADAPDFKPYDQVTEAEVLAWVWGSVDKDETESNLAKQIEDQKSPKTETGLPWG